MKVPVVAHLHEALWPGMPDWDLLGEGFVATYAQATEDAARRAARVLTVSAASRDALMAAYDLDPDRVVVAHNGVDHDVYRPGLPPVDDLLADAGGDPARPYVLYVSTVHPRKNLQALRDAMARVAAEGRDAALVLVAGPAPDRANSDDLLAAATAAIAGISTPVVNLAGADDHAVARLMANAAVFCLPSRMEGFGMAVTEAMACGAPVVVSDRGALPEIVGDAGIVAEPTAESLAEALADVLDHSSRAADLRDMAIRRAARFTWDATAAAWWGAIESALG